MRYILPLFVLLAIVVGCCRSQQIESGTLVFSNKSSLVGRIAKRVSGGDHYTHVGIVIDGYVYESDWPRSKKTPVNQYGKRFTTNDYYRPNHALDVTAMRSTAESMLGQRYSLKNYFRPGSQPSNGTWCSPFAGRVLNSGGYNLTPTQFHEPQAIYNTIRPQFSFVQRVTRH